MEKTNHVEFRSISNFVDDYEITFRLHGEDFFEPVDVCLHVAVTESVDEAIRQARLKLRGSLGEMYESISV